MKQPTAKQLPVAPIKKGTAQASCCHRPSSLPLAGERLFHQTSLTPRSNTQEKSFESMVAKKAVNNKREQARRRSSRYPVTLNPPHTLPVSVPPRAPTPIRTFR